LLEVTIDGGFSSEDVPGVSGSVEDDGVVVVEGVVLVAVVGVVETVGGVVVVESSCTVERRATPVVLRMSVPLPSRPSISVSRAVAS
jgi:hypothetical protein